MSAGTRSPTTAAEARKVAASTTRTPGAPTAAISAPAAGAQGPWPGAHWRLTLAHRYPTVLPVLLTRAYVAPEAVRLVRRLYALLDRAGVPEDRVFRIERMFSTFLLGYTISAANNAFWDDDPASLAVTHAPVPALNRGGDRDRWARGLDQDLASFFALITDARTA